MSHPFRKVITMRNRLLLMLLAAASAVALAGCDTTSEDRGGGRGINVSTPDAVEDVDYITVYRNVNNWPNFAVMCAGGFGYVTTRTGGNGSAELVTPDPRWDDFCADKEYVE